MTLDLKIGIVFVFVAMVGCDRSKGDSDSTDTEETVPSWNTTEILSVNAPDGYSVRVAFEGTPPADQAGDPLRYQIDSSYGGLEVESAEFDPNTGIAVLGTSRQKLGVSYTIAVRDDAGDLMEGLTADFLSADTFLFWAFDYSEMVQRQLVADRVAVGDHGVIYVEQGMNVSGIEQALGQFDSTVYPIGTSLFIDAPDVDGNDKIILLGEDCGGGFGGYFDPTTSMINAMEIIHINVADGGFDSSGRTIPHEFQHLLYHERHDVTDVYWAYHNEGLSECAVHAVLGENDQAIYCYHMDYQGLIAKGLSLVNWTYALYENYALAYLFWTYLASRLGGIDACGEIFDLDTGSPAEVDELIANTLGSDFPTVQMEGLIANWVRAPTGIYGHEGLVEFDSTDPPHVAAGTTSVDLEPFAGTFFVLDETGVEYPGTQGEHIVYAGIDCAGAVDLDSTFDVAGGALLVFNANFEYSTFPAEPSGPDLPAVGSKWTPELEAAISPAWLDPPPTGMLDLEALEQWREARQARLAR